ncbi:MAG: sodium:solute symporter family protein [Gemmatimonadota bacterium]|nr:sodium:solute symporter family protein [Gemmatimonadota bacterium]MDE2871812.1 sodium:solute symporter family protein [Gemmatimonadota bacterium]
MSAAVTLGILLLYVALITAVGLAIGRRVSGTRDFFVAGRALGPGLLFATLLAANIGAGSTVGAAGLGYANGIAAWWWVGSAGIGTLVLALWLGPRMWRVARDHSLRTVGDYLEHRYGPSVRAAMAMLLWLGTLAILAGQLIAMAWILEVVAGAPKWLGAVAGGVVMTVYFVAGGLLSSAWVNLVQLVVLTVGFLIAVPLAVGGAGGLSAVLESARAVPGHLDFMSNGSSGWTYLVLLAPAFIVSPGILQKIFGARDVRTVRVGVGACGVALMLFAVLPPALGMVAHAVAPGLDNSELALPVILTEGVPAWVGLLGLAAVLSAEISSADAILFMLATSLSKDLYKRFVKPAATDRQVLKVARVAAVSGGVAGVVLAVVIPNVVGALTIFYALLGVSLFVPVVAGLHSRRPGSVEALAAAGAGVAALLVARSAGAGGWMPPSAWGLAFAAAAYGVFHAALRMARRGNEMST